MSESQAWAEGRRVGYRLGREDGLRECPTGAELSVEAAMTCYRQGYAASREEAIRLARERRDRLVADARRDEGRRRNISHYAGALDEAAYLVWMLQGFPGRGISRSFHVEDYMIADGHVASIYYAGPQGVRVGWSCSCREPGVGGTWSTMIMGAKRMAREHVFGRRGRVGG